MCDQLDAVVPLLLRRMELRGVHAYMYIHHRMGLLDITDWQELPDVPYSPTLERCIGEALAHNILRVRGTTLLRRHPRRREDYVRGLTPRGISQREDQGYLTTMAEVYHCTAHILYWNSKGYWGRGLARLLADEIEHAWDASLWKHCVGIAVRAGAWPPGMPRSLPRSLAFPRSLTEPSSRYRMLSFLTYRVLCGTVGARACWPG